MKNSPKKETLLRIEDLSRAVTELGLYLTQDNTQQLPSQTKETLANLKSVMENSLSLYRSVLDSTTEAILIVDAHGRVLACNRSFLNLWGIKQNGLGDLDERRFFASIEKRLKNAESMWRLDGKLRARPGMEHYDVLEFQDGTVVERYCIPREVEGVDAGRVWCFRDITAQHETERKLIESEKQYRLMFENNPHPMLVADVETMKILAVNEAAVQHYGYNRNEFLELTLKDIRPAEDSPDLSSTWTRKKEDRVRTHTTIRRHRKKDGSLIDVEFISHDIVFQGRKARLALISDVTQKRQAQETLDLLIRVTAAAGEAEDLHTMTARCLEVICRSKLWQVGQVWLVDEKQNDLFCSHTFWSEIDITEFRGESLKVRYGKGMDVPGKVWERETPVWIEQLSDDPSCLRRDTAIRTGLQSCFAFPIKQNNEILAVFEFLSTEARSLDSSLLEVLEQLGNHLGIVFTRRREQETIRHQAYHDVLTELPNRILFQDRLAQALAQAHRAREMMALLFLDLDRFKTINDTLGHDVGDKLLLEVSERLSKCLREGDTVARMGGDEFTVILPTIRQMEDAAKVAEKILAVFEDPFQLSGHEFLMTTSIGISLFPQDARDPQSLMKNADVALYRAKEKGRNNYQLYNPSMTITALQRLKLETHLRNALERREFILHYQPQVHIETGDVIGVEALLRWQNPEMGFFLPAEFIHVAEDIGIISDIWEWALGVACRQNKEWQIAGLPVFPMTMNISAAQFQHTNLVKTVSTVIREAGLYPDCLELEITESMAMKVEFTIFVLQELKEMGVRICMDDFGIGYSSLSYIKRFPIDTIKIDPYFVRELTSSEKDHAIAAAIVALGHGLNMRVIAEGVETVEQLDALRAIGCDGIQGFLCCRPAPAEVITPLLAKRLL